MFVVGKRGSVDTMGRQSEEGKHFSMPPYTKRRKKLHGEKPLALQTDISVFL